MSFDALFKKTRMSHQLALFDVQVKTIEKIIGCGQVEELVEQANDELSLIEDYYRSECTFVTYILGDRLWEGPKIENP